MMPALKTEVRKLLSVRSTLFITLSAFLLTSGLIAFWIFGFKNIEHADGNAHALLTTLYNVVAISGVFFSIITVLSVGHEYRYNTIMYSLTSINRRTKVFFAKFFVLAVFALLVGAVLAGLAAIAFYIGIKSGDIQAVAQHIPVAEMLWHVAASILGSVALGFILAVIIRSLIGAMVTILMVPSTIEGLLTLLLKDNVKYLPFTALGNLTSSNSAVNPTMSLGIVCGYVAVFGLVAYVLFLKRDAN